MAIDNKKILERLDTFEALLMAGLEECHKTRKLLDGADRPAARKGSDESLIKHNRKRRLARK